MGPVGPGGAIFRLTSGAVNGHRKVPEGVGAQIANVDCTLSAGISKFNGESRVARTGSRKRIRIGVGLVTKRVNQGSGNRNMAGITVRDVQVVVQISEAW